MKIDCTSVLLDMQKDIKKLLADVAVLKFKASIYGMIGGALVVLTTFILKSMGVI